ncbi:MAG: histidine ammonia-lyase [Acidobacteriota bacterium]|nr:histidine ammonia-lyase [Acidobacteriota bacterium]MDE3168928.1 histidine ammonia-lyase [Acidobacteriota bacterium]
MATIVIDGESLTLENLYRLVFDFPESQAEIPASVRERMAASRAVIDRLAESEAAVYGVNTGFGKLATTRISHDEIRHLQLNLVRSHACGVGEPLGEAATRAMLALRANALAKGFSGVRPIVAETLLAMLNRNVLPVIPSQGSVGASGDLAPLAHLALAAIGEGEASFDGRRMAGGEALRASGIAPLVLQAKEGLALLNGTQAMLALVALAVRDAEIAADTADVAASLSLDALRGSPVAFDERIADARPHPGHARVAENLRRLNRGSEIRESHRAPERDPRVQDPYSLRCAPQVHGAARDAIARVRATAEIELNSATDNPLVFADSGDVLSGGNFHGQPLAMAADHLALALATLGGISERRTEQMTNPQSSQLPAFLVRHAGLNSGFMILQVTAAALASETKALAAPHSADSIPTSANQEDYVSMGMGAARRLEPMIANLRNILAIELLAAAQGIDLLAPLRPGTEARRAHEMIRTLSKTLDADRSLSADIARVAGSVARGEFAALLG